MKSMARTYHELSQLPTIQERYQYLRLSGVVGQDTFGFDRYLNQIFYKSPLWLSVRRKILIRDDGCEMGLSGYPIGGKIIVHHINPIVEQDILDESEDLVNPDYLVCVSHQVHMAIHYGDERLLPKDPIVRTPYDTCPWKRKENKNE